MAEDIHADAEGRQPRHDLEEHLGTGALDDQGREKAEPSSERGDSLELRAQDRVASSGSDGAQKAVAQVIRLVPKHVAPVVTESSVPDFLEILHRHLTGGELPAPTGLIVHAVCADGRTRFWKWNLTTLEHVGLLTTAVQDVIMNEAQRP